MPNDSEQQQSIQPDAADKARRARRRTRALRLGALGLLALSIAVLVAVPSALAQDQGKAPLTQPLMAMLALGALSMAPFVLVMTTSFLKFSVVGSILRSAMGTQQIPPNQVLMGLSLILTIYVMGPVGRQIYKNTKDLIDQGVEEGVFSDGGIELIQTAIDRGKKPYFDFLLKHSKEKDRRLFLMLGKQLNRDDPTYEADERSFMGLTAAFVTSELTEAFQIGFILFVPFIVIDMIVSNVLLAMGMQMLSPTIVSLPIKLLLFVLVDGWHLLMRGLVLGYA